MKSPVVKRSIVIAGHKTSVSLEDAFWKGMKEIAEARDITLSQLVASIDTRRQHGNLSSAIRLFVLDFYRNRLPDEQAERNERVAPPLVPLHDSDVLFVLCESSSSGPTYIETNPADANEDAIVRNMIAGQYGKPLRVVAINIGEGWARDVSKKIAGVVVQAAERGDRTLPSGTRAFVKAQLASPVRH
jgi:predicted DNA-binding ribbon-helix-helix protein